MLAQLKPRQIVIVALLTSFTTMPSWPPSAITSTSSSSNPSSSPAQALEIEAEARKRNLVVGVEYHKRLDDRSLLARRRYRAGMFGEFKLGTARLMEKWYYRHSNFQNWCTAENSDAFTYIGCHYVDLVAFVTGLKPVAVSVYGIKDRYPNGNEGYLYTDARVIWENGACLNVQNSLSFPDAAPGTNTQGITMYFAGAGPDGAPRGGWLEHSDQYRGLKYSYIQEPSSPGATMFTEPSTDYFQYVDLGGPGLEVVGYGFRSVEFIIRNILQVEAPPRATARASSVSLMRQESWPRPPIVSTTNWWSKPDASPSSPVAARSPSNSRHLRDKVNRATSVNRLISLNAKRRQPRDMMRVP
ncbi:MAG: hypothetical protein IPJ98_24585 [Bryobacterales bacterium]|nr:hypothetical protein [Bryobacterales bacterium]